MSVGELVAGRVRSVRREMGNPLYRNAYALMLNTVVNSGFGLLYWVFAARVFSTEDVGRGNAMVNLMMLISVLTSLNFGQALIRFLPTAGRDSRSLVRLAYGISAAVAVVGSAAVMTYCHFAYAPGDPLHVSPGFAAWFVVSTAAWSIFNLQDQVLTGLRSAMWVVLENGVYGVVKLGLLVVVAFTSVSDGVFTSWSAPVIALLVPFTLLISRRLLPRHTAETADRDDAGAPDRATLARYMGGDSPFKDPILHYLEIGHDMGAQPNPFFDGSHYLLRNSDVADAGMNPFVHYVMTGRDQTRPTYDWDAEGAGDGEAMSRFKRLYPWHSADLDGLERILAATPKDRLLSVLRDI